MTICSLCDLPRFSGGVQNVPQCKCVVKHEWPIYGDSKEPLQPAQPINIAARIDILFCKLDRLENAVLELTKAITKQPG